MHVIDAPAVAARGREHVAAGEVEVPGIEQQADRIAGPRHQQVDLAFALDHRAHVVVEGHRAALGAQPFGELGQLVAVALELLVRHAWARGDGVSIAACTVSVVSA